MEARTILLLLGSIACLAACDGPAPMPDAGCTPGSAGCACLEGEICTGSAVCEMGICRGVDTDEIEVTDVAARACEVVVQEQATEVLGVDFSAGTRGTHVHESPRTAVTFAREDDTAFPAGSVRLRRTEGTAGMLMLRRARCFDRDGNELAGEPLRLVE
jgi:hypothetical protein